eukprot:CAMPEP_0113850866 /NCGR_PEP_ID=MMETSP0372-20130328/4199_1 /TAXON_ID=340204 /ORGANISM="Lankesteria abbotti" /LENGTH=150 /DNA_ID=CAMNT_0000821365 /DNA_START=133 /DNA_END=585 /DNA_ORIENTATION=- /assembly_acc=CAM_ASM_000359
MAPWLVQAISIAASLYCVIWGIISLISFNILQLAINIYILLFGVMGLIADVRAFSIFGYVKFLYTAFGRGLFFTLIGFLMLGSGLFDIISGVVMIGVGILYFVMARIFGGVPKPLLQRKVEELPLNTELHFVSLEEGNRVTTATSQPGAI